MRWLHCPHLQAAVELTGEREIHIETEHPPLLPDHLDQLLATVADPDFVGTRPGRAEIAFIRAWPEFDGRSIIVVVVTDGDSPGATLRHWW